MNLVVYIKLNPFTEKFLKTIKRFSRRRHSLSLFILLFGEIEWHKLGREEKRGNIRFCYGTFALYCYICRLNLLKGFNLNVDTLEIVHTATKSNTKKSELFFVQVRKKIPGLTIPKRIWKFDALPLPTDKLWEDQNYFHSYHPANPQPKTPSSACNSFHLVSSCLVSSHLITLV